MGRYMGESNMLSKIELTAIKPDLRAKEIKRYINVVAESNCRAIVVNPNSVGLAKKLLSKHGEPSVKIVTVLNFPWHWKNLSSWCNLLVTDRGAWDELDALIPMSYFTAPTKSKRLELLESYIAFLKNTFAGKPIRLIAETVLMRRTFGKNWKKGLSEVAKLYRKNNLVFKTNSGLFGRPFPDLVEEVKYIRSNWFRFRGVSIKAAGGISTPDQVKELLRSGVRYVGTSKLSLVRAITSGEQNV